MRLGLVIVVLAGCGRFGFGDTERVADANDAPDTAPPDAFVCLAPSGHDEDSDGHDDACDPCPHVAGDRADTDGDGIGDTCDPSTVAHALILFDPFTAATSQWTYSQQAMFVVDAIALPAINNSVGIKLVAPPVRAHYTFAGTIDAVGAIGSRQVAIHVDPAGGPTSFYCELYDNATGANPTFKLTHFDGTNYNNLDGVMLPTPYTSGAFTMLFDYDPPNMACTLRWQGAVYDVQAPVPAGVPADILSFASNNTDVRVTSFAQIGPR